MTGLSLQIDGKWAVLSDDVSVSIEDNSPVWGEGNSFSLPFELDIEANRHILGNADQITGQSVYEVLDGKRAVLYTLGIPVYYGKIKMDDEVELSEGTVDITLVSGNLTFDEMIDGMNCQDVELMDEIIVGEGIDYFQGLFMNFGTQRTIYLPPDLMHMKVNGVSTVNVSESYPIAKYCNVRVAYQLPDKPEKPNSSSEAFPDVESSCLENKKIVDIREGGFASYLVLDADRPLSGLCFFVLYFLECLFSKLGIVSDLSSLSAMEDMRRLAFFTTRCSCTLKDTGVFIKSEEVRSIVPSFRSEGEVWFTNYGGYHKCHYVANSGNFPDDDVANVIDSLRNGFGIRFLSDESNRTIKGVFLKDILLDNEIRSLHSVQIYNAVKSENNLTGLKIMYSGGDEDTSYNYTEWNKVTDETKSYEEILHEIYSYNETLYLDNKTGNAYRVKVDKDAKTSSELHPVLSEVAEFNPVEYGDCQTEDGIETIEIPFTPIKQNDVYKGEDVSNLQTFATFIDVSMQYPSMVPWTSIDFFGTDLKYGYTYFSAQQSSADGAIHDFDYRQSSVRFDNSNSLFDYDSGLTLGIMRGPGRKAGVEDYDQNYDGENNSKYVVVAQDYTFHSDTVDNYGRLFDYNGEMTGGVDTSGRFSLKLRAEKPNPEGGFYPITESYAQRRGLFDKFYSEYAYFVVNRKIVKMKCRMEMADLLNIDWTKRYKIGEYVGFINKYSYSVSSTGMSDVELEMYYL